jgi:hypothetical protein
MNVQHLGPARDLATARPGDHTGSVSKASSRTKGWICEGQKASCRPGNLFSTSKDM